MPRRWQKSGDAQAGAPASTLQPSNFGDSVGAPSPFFDRDFPPPPCPPALKRYVWKADPMGQEMHEMLEPAMFVGLGAVAVWAYVRYPRLRPGSLVWAVVHVAVSFTGFALLPTTLGLLLPLVPSHTEQPYVVLVLLVPVLTYVLLSWIWLIARVLHDLLGGTPRGGHPVSAEH
jgi:hypothetical protein